MRIEFIAIYHLIHRRYSINGNYYYYYEKENPKVGPSGPSLVYIKTIWIIASVRLPGDYMPVPSFFNPNPCL